MRNYKIIGLTGPSGSGKGIIAQELKNYGCAVVDADSLAHEMLKKGSPCLLALTAAFGNNILDNEGNICRKELAKIAFANEQNTQILNSITHPHIYVLAFKKIKEYIQEGFQTIIFDAPVLLETNGDIICDYLVAVISDIKTRTDRIITRDGITIEQAQQRLQIQQSDEFYTSCADLVINNNGSIADLQKKATLILNL